MHTAHPHRILKKKPNPLPPLFLSLKVISNVAYVVYVLVLLTSWWMCVTALRCWWSTIVVRCILMIGDVVLFAGDFDGGDVRYGLLLHLSRADAVCSVSNTVLFSMAICDAVGHVTVRVWVYLFRSDPVVIVWEHRLWGKKIDILNFWTPILTTQKVLKKYYHFEMNIYFIIL